MVQILDFGVSYNPQKVANKYYDSSIGELSATDQISFNDTVLSEYIPDLVEAQKEVLRDQFQAVEASARKPYEDAITAHQALADDWQRKIDAIKEEIKQEGASTVTDTKEDLIRNLNSYQEHLDEAKRRVAREPDQQDQIDYYQDLVDKTNEKIARRQQKEDYQKELEKENQIIQANQHRIDNINSYSSKIENSNLLYSREAFAKARDEATDETEKKFFNTILKDNRFECIAGLDSSYNPLGITRSDLESIASRNGEQSTGTQSIMLDDFTDWLDAGKDNFLDEADEQAKNAYGKLQDCIVNNAPLGVDFGSSFPTESQNESLEIGFSVYNGKDPLQEKSLPLGKVVAPDLYMEPEEKSSGSWLSSLWPF